VLCVVEVRPPQLRPILKGSRAKYGKHANLHAQVLCATGATPTLTGNPYRQWAWSNDEPAASSGTNDEFECLVPLNCVWDSTGDANIEPIVLREGEGVSVHHPGSSAVGNADIFLEFTNSAT
jgi:hypothetical protein